MDKLKNYLYSIAKKSSVRKWALSLTGWKWWFYQIVVCGIIFLTLEWILNQIGMTMLPRRRVRRIRRKEKKKRRRRKRVDTDTTNSKNSTLWLRNK